MAFSIRFSSRVLAAALLTLLVSASTWAASRSDLYTAEVPLARGVDDARTLAYQAALDAVIARIVPFESRAEALVLFESPAQWVIGWREGEADTLIVSFDGRAMTALLRAQRIPVWGGDRPETLVWLAIEDFDGTRRLLDALEPPEPAAAFPPEDPALAEPVRVGPRRAEFGPALADAAQRFGIPVRLPSYDEADLSAVNVSDIWGGFSNVIVEASARYGVDSVLIGRASERNPTAIRWTWLFAGGEYRFSGDANLAFARVSSRMMTRFASSAEASADVRISVVAVEGLEDYARLMQFMGSRSLVEDVRVLAMRGDQLLLGVDALASRGRLADMLEGTVLERIERPFRAVPFAGSAGDLVLGTPESPVRFGEIAQAGTPQAAEGAEDGMEAPPTDVPGPSVPGSAPAPAFDAADFYFRLRPAGAQRD